MEITKEIESLIMKGEEKHGGKNQLIVCVEEMSELQKEICKLLRTDATQDIEHLSEEIADVEICIAMLKVLLGNIKEVDKWRAKKLYRMQERLNL